MNDLISREDAIKEAYTITIDGESFDVVQVETLEGLPSEQPEDYTELKREFLRMASYIDVLLECSDVQKETLIGFISRLAEFMPRTEMGLNMDDSISRLAAIKTLHDEILKRRLDGDVNDGRLDEFDTESILRRLPSAQPELQWIPCSDQKRLPNYREPVLISTYWGVRMAERYAAKEDGTDDFWYLFLDDATASPRYVYAWMPLPEPYKGE